MRNSVRLWAIAVGLSLAVGHPLGAQNIVFDNDGPTTPLGSYLQAQAQLAVGLGAFHESIAIARNDHAEAYEKELKNQILELESWIEKKEINRKYRQSLSPNYTDRNTIQSLAIRRRIEDQYDDLTRGDVTVYLNWMLDQLAATEYAAQRGAADSPSLAQIDRPLSSETVTHLLLTDGGRANGQQLTFRAHSGRVLETDWPVALRAEEFRLDREHFESVRDQVMQELHQGGRIHEQDAQRLRQACDALDATFCSLYGYPRSEVGRKRRLENYQDYRAGRDYLNALALAVKRVVATNNRELLQGAYAFKGNTVRDLVRHMCQRGCHFARPEIGDEGAYVKLFHDLRFIYMGVQSKLDPARNAGFRN